MSRNICHEADLIEEKVTRYDVVSFDIFDTLVIRNVVKPNDVFSLIEEKAKAIGINAEGFADSRAEAESLAARRLGVGNDVCIEDIYQDLPYADRDALKKIELDIERKIIAPNKSMIGLANRLRENGKIVIAISDMYLPASFLTDVLANFGCSLDRLYVSGDIGLRKSRGSLFSYVLQDLNIEPESIVHIGDNRRSDYIIPALKRISTVLYKPMAAHTPPVESLADSVVGGILKRQNYRESVALEGVGYSCLGPLLVGMCQWIHREVVDLGHSSLRFLSRDGYILSKAYSIMYPSSPYRYSYVSRRSLTVPLLIDAQSFADVLEIIPYIKRVESMPSLFTKLGIDDEDLIVRMEKTYGTLLKRSDLADGMYDPLFDEIKEMVWLNAADEKACMEEYISQHFAGRVFTVDLGWYGSIQKRLERVTNARIYGLYLGLLRHTPDYCLENARGYVYDYRLGDTSDSSFVFSFNGLIETIFSAPHGSVKRYRRTAEGVYKPEFANLEAENQKAVSKIHAGALSFVKDYIEAADGLPCGVVSPRTAYANMERLLTRPTSEESRILGDMVFYDATCDPLVCFDSTAAYLLHPKKFVSDFLRSNWKIGFLSRLVKGDFAKSLYAILVKMKKD